MGVMLAGRKGRLALITGASSGLGEIFARRLAQAGMNVILVARREGLLRGLAGEFRDKFGVDADVCVADLVSEGDVARVVELIKERKPSMLVNNAGFGLSTPFVESDIDSQIAMVRLHCETPVRLMHAALPSMIEERDGDIINVSSVAGFLSSPGSGSYCASKAYLTTLSKSLHLDVEPKGVRVQALCPGFTHTNFHGTASMVNFDKEDVPDRMWMDAEDVVETSLKALDRNKSVVIPGFIYRFVVWFVRLSIARPFVRASLRKHARELEQRNRRGEPV